LNKRFEPLVENIVFTRAKKSIDDFGSQSLLTDDDNSQSSIASDSSMQHFIQIDQEELKQVNISK